MARLLRPVPLEFADDAPVRMAFSRQVAAVPAAVYGALAEDVESWPEWYGAVAAAEPFEGGRRVRLKGGVRLTETILAAEPGRRYAYRVEEANVPGLRALLEDWRLEAADGGTRVTWVWASAGPAPARLLLRLARPGMDRAFRGAMRALERRLATH